MLSWKALQALLVLTLTAGEYAVSANHMLRNVNPKHRRRLGLREQCRARATFASSTVASSTTHSTSSTPTTTSTTTTTHTTTHTTHTTTSKTAAPTPKVTNSVSSSGFTPNGIKAGLSAGNAYFILENHIGWWYDWTPDPSNPGSPIAVPMLWGDGQADPTDAARLAAFKQITTAPQYVLGYEEPDCPSGSGSAGMSVAEGAALWDQLIAPFAAKGTKLGSPSMCKQAAETWLAEFETQISTPWDFTAIHVNKNNIDGVKEDVDHYWSKYGRPIWVTEFACVDDSTGFVPCTSQSEINSFIEAIVDYFESDDRVYAYAFSNGYGLGNVWPMMDGSSLSESGQTYLNAISKYH